MAEGYVEPKSGGGYQYIYQYADHLGNIRLAYTDTNGDGTIDPASEIVEENHYYPFGLKHRGYSANPIGRDHKFEYNGTELEEGLGLDMMEMDMRQYDAALARWVVQDPVVHHSMSPYNAFDNNPVYWADPSGADAVDDMIYKGGLRYANTDEGQWKHTKNGEYQNLGTGETTNNWNKAVEETNSSETKKKRKNFARKLFEKAKSLLPEEMQSEVDKALEQIRSEIKDFDFTKLALGIESSLGGSSTSGSKVEGSLISGNVIFFGGEDAGYVYSYYGKEGGVGIETSVVTGVNTGKFFYLAYNRE
ncbi:RHS repeat domain-containing protein [Flavobacteriaceae bacterium M23B6Z8]